jgi:hypothetical protein
MKCHAIQWKPVSVSEEHVTSILRIQDLANQETSMKQEAVLACDCMFDIKIAIAKAKIELVKWF